MHQKAEIMASQLSQRRGGPAGVVPQPFVIPTVREARELWIAHRKLYRDISENTDLFYRQQTKALGAVVGEDSPVNLVAMEDIETVLLAIRDRSRSPAAAFRAMKAFVRWQGVEFIGREDDNAVLVVTLKGHL